MCQKVVVREGMRKELVLSNGRGTTLQLPLPGPIREPGGVQERTQERTREENTNFAASARDTTKSTLSPSDVEESLISKIVATGLLNFRCIKRSIATLAPSTTSARRLFCLTGRIEFRVFVQPLHVLVVMETTGTPPPLDPNVTKPILSRSPRFWTRNLNASRRSVILSPCIDEDTGITTTKSKGTWIEVGRRWLDPRPEF